MIYEPVHTRPDCVNVDGSVVGDVASVNVVSLNPELH